MLPSTKYSCTPLDFLLLLPLPPSEPPQPARTSDPAAATTATRMSVLGRYMEPPHSRGVVLPEGSPERHGQPMRTGVRDPRHHSACCQFVT